MTGGIASTGRGSSWDSSAAAERVTRAYLAADLTAIRTGQIDLLEPQPGEGIVDVGAGPGVFACALAVAGARVTAVDSSPSMLAAAERQAREQGVEITVLEGDAGSLPFPDGAFDAACVVQVLEYVVDPVAVLREAARVVRPGGRVLVADSDWDTAAFAVSDLDLARRVIGAFADGKLHGRSGRYLRGWLVAAGLDPVRSRPQVLSSGPGKDTFFTHNWPYWLKTIERLGTVRSEDIDRFRSEVDDAAGRGEEVFSLVRNAWVATVPGGGAP